MFLQALPGEYQREIMRLATSTILALFMRQAARSFLAGHYRSENSVAATPASAERDYSQEQFDSVVFHV